MSNMSLDQWKVDTPKSQVKRPLILSDAHAEYLVEKFCPEILLCKQIKAKLAEEKIEREIKIKQHENYVNNNYVRVGESNG